MAFSLLQSLDNIKNAKVGLKVWMAINYTKGDGCFASWKVQMAINYTKGSGLLAFLPVAWFKWQ